MRLTEDEITEFLNLFKKRYGFEITRDDAIERATRLVNLIGSLYLTPESQKVREMSKEAREKVDLDIIERISKYRLVVKPKPTSK